MKLNKAILIPLLTAIIEFVKQSTGYEIPFGDNVDAASDVILWAITAAGIFIHPKKDALSAAEKNYLEG